MASRAGGRRPGWPAAGSAPWCWSPGSPPGIGGPGRVAPPVPAAPPRPAWQPPRTRARPRRGLPWATRIRSSSAALATRSCRARSAAVDRTWMSAPSDQGTTSQLVHPQQQDRRQVVRVSHQARQGEGDRHRRRQPTCQQRRVHAMAPGDLEHRHHHAQLDGAVGVAGQQIDAHRPDRAAECRHGRGAPPASAPAAATMSRTAHTSSGRGGRWKVAARTEPAMTTAAAPAASQTSIGGGTPGASLHRRGACILRAG